MLAPTASIVYKSSPIPISFDLYSPSKPSTTPGVCILYYHIGALYYGNRRGAFPEWFARGCIERGWTFLSADYRLLPETPIEGIVEDVKDMWNFIHTQLPAELSSRNLTPINLSSVFLSGASAGGYLTLSNGQWLSPSPRGLVSLYGYTFSSDFFSTPQSPELIMMGDPVGNVEPQAKEIEEFWQEGRSVVANRPFDLTDMSKPETLLYTYQILKGTYFQNTFGVPSGSHITPTTNTHLHRYFPELSITDSYPPVILLHGSADSAIPASESIEFAQCLKEKGFNAELVVLDGMEHCWDLEDGNEEVEKGRRKVWSFVQKLAEV